MRGRGGGGGVRAGWREGKCARARKRLLAGRAHRHSHRHAPGAHEHTPAHTGTLQPTRDTLEHTRAHSSTGHQPSFSRTCSWVSLVILYITNETCGYAVVYSTSLFTHLLLGVAGDEHVQVLVLPAVLRLALLAVLDAARTPHETRGYAVVYY